MELNRPTRVEPGLRLVDDAERLASSMSSRLERLWAEAHRELDRADLDPGAVASWATALDQLVVALQALEDAEPRPGGGHRTWDGRRPG